MGDPSVGPRPLLDLLVLTGGRGERMGGVDKGALVVGGQPLLERVLTGALPVVDGRVVLVGGAAPADVLLAARVTATREEPPGGGPAAALAAGLAELRRPSGGSTAPAAQPRPPAPWVAVLAVDQPGAGQVLALLAPTLAAQPAEVEAVAPADPSGRRQWLLAVYRTKALAPRFAGAGPLHGAALGPLLRDLRWVEVPVPHALLGDVDTPDDLEAWRRRG